MQKETPGGLEGWEHEKAGTLAMEVVLAKYDQERSISPTSSHQNSVSMLPLSLTVN